jgi:hypothetical protein
MSACASRAPRATLTPAHGGCTSRPGVDHILAAARSEYGNTQLVSCALPARVLCARSAAARVKAESHVGAARTGVLCAVMSKLGDVVFCVDCDRVRAAHAGTAAAGFEGAPVDQPPRRMATKRDANGDPLCAACLDARHGSRHAKFMSHEARSPLAGGALGVAAAGVEPAAIGLRSSRFIRVLRTREPMAEVPSPSPSKGKPARPASQPTEAPPPRPPGRRVERRFAMLVLELGFRRAQQLIDELDVRSRKVARSAARVAAPQRTKKRARRG